MPDAVSQLLPESQPAPISDGAARAADVLLLRHYPYDGQESMKRYGDFLQQGFESQGVRCSSITPEPKFGKISKSSSGLGKWLGYIDKFMLFPRRFKRNGGEFFCIPDHSHGIYLHWLKNRNHVIHCHDFMAIHSARGVYPQNRTGASGRIYQKLILSGLAKAENVICVSEKTAADFRALLPESNARIEVIHNGLNYDYHPTSAEEQQRVVQEQLPGIESPFILHVGGNQWYKNREGVLQIYAAYLEAQPSASEHLVMVGKPPTQGMLAISETPKLQGRVHYLSGVSNEDLRAIYGAAQCLLFPSIIEGFGWPIAEAQACGTPVIATGVAPLTEVGGEAAAYLNPVPIDPGAREAWAMDSASKLATLLQHIESDPTYGKEESIANSRRFDPAETIHKILAFYRSAGLTTSG